MVLQRPGAGLANRPPGDPGDPHTARWVLYPEGSRTRRIIDSALTSAGITPSVVLESDNPAVLRQMVVMGLGWSVLPPAIAEDEAREPALRRGERVAERPLAATWRRTSPPNARFDAFLALTRAEVTTSPLT